MSRTRLIRPEFFSDETMARAPIPTRLVYIGLWTLCDDAGYFDLAPRQIAAALFPYDGNAKRNRLTDEALATLTDMARVKPLECGEHAIVPTIPDHRIKGGEQLFTIKKRHERRCLSRTPVELHSRAVRRDYVVPTEDSVSESVSDSVSVSVSNSAQARTTMDDAAVKAGGFVGRLAARRNGAPT